VVQSPKIRPWLGPFALLVAAACGDRSAAEPGIERVDSVAVADEIATDEIAMGPATATPPSGAFEIPGLDRHRPQPRLGWPVQSVHITSSFGWRVDPVSGRGVRMHGGVDFRGAPGDLVLSIGAGEIEFVGHDPFLGNMVIVDHGQGLRSLYGHLSDTLVVAQMPVDRGAAIGLVGNTGRSAAPHLHLTVKLDGRTIDPLDVIGEPLHAPGALATSLEETLEAPTSPTRAIDPADEPVAPPPARGPPRTLPNRSDDGGP